MGMLAYVANFDELAKEIAELDIEVTATLDTSGIEDLLERFFPELFALLDKQDEDELSRTQKIRGFVTSGETITFIPEKDIALTGVSFSQNTFSPADKWSLSVINGGAEVVLLDGVFSKDSLQHKYFESFFPVPAGCQVAIRPHGSGGGEKTFWFDLEYLEAV